MDFSDQDRNAILDAENNLQQLQQTHAENQAHIDDFSRKIDSQEANLSFSERFLGGWVFGDREKVKKLNMDKDVKAVFNERAAYISKEARKLEADIRQKVGAAMENESPDFAELKSEHEKHIEMRANIDAYLSDIDTVYTQVNTAENWELADLAGNNKGISAVSYMETSAAKDMLAQFEDSSSEFNEKLSAYSEKHQNKSSFIGNIPNNNLDLVMDMIGALDIFSYFNFKALGDARRQLTDLRDTVSEIRKEVDTSCQQFEQKVNEQIDQKRSQIKRGSAAPTV